MTTVISGSTGINNVAPSTVLQADLASNVVGNGPAFSAYPSGAQTVTSATYTKVNLQTEEFDTNNNFDPSTSRFTPSVAGYYQINGIVFISTTATGVEAVIYKNGAAIKYGSYTNTSSAGTVSQVSSVVYLNGTTDYVELYVLVTGTTPSVGSSTAFNGCMVRASNILLDGGIPVTSNTVYVEEPPMGFKNYLINASCLITQRGNVAVTNGAYVYGGADRFCVQAAGTAASGTIQRYSGVATTSGFAQGVLATTTGTGQVFIQQRLESFNVAGLNGKTITVSAIAYQNTGSTQSAYIWINKPTTTADTFSAQSTVSNSGAISIPSGVPTAISWTYTLGATEASLGLSVTVGYGNIGAVTAKDFWVGDFQLERGTVPTRFDFRPYHVELAACQRYYEVMQNISMGFPCPSTGGFSHVFYVPWKVTKRIIVVPSYTLTSASNLSTYNTQYSTTDGFSFQAVGTAMTNTQFLLTGTTVNAEL